MPRFWMVLTYLLSLFTRSVDAQVSAGLGIQVDFPLLYNKNVGSYNHSLGAWGPRLSIKYIPQNTAFYPSLTLNVTTLTIPLIKSNENVISMRFFAANAALAVNRQHVYENNMELHYGLGIGLAYLGGVGVGINGSNNGASSNTIVSFSADSSYISSWLPFFHAGIEYIFPASSQKPIFVGIGGKLQYIYLFDNGEKFHTTIIDSRYQVTRLQPTLYGHMFNPGFYISFYYKFGRKDY